jgi:hypothetical protein
MTSEIEFGENCPLTRHLLEVSMSDGRDNKAQFAGSLLLGLGYPQLGLKLPDLTFTAQLLRSITETGQTDLLPEVTAKCTHCPQSGNCEVGALFKAD